MTKHTIVRLFVGSLIALAGGLVLLLGAGALALANGDLVMDGPDVVGARFSAFGWAMIAVACVGALVLFAAGVTAFVAWIAAVIDTAQLPDKTLFVVLLVTGLLSFGFVGMIVYLIAAPDRRAPIPPGGQPQYPPVKAA